jgi:hypothetical protein
LNHCRVAMDALQSFMAFMPIQRGLMSRPLTQDAV